MRASRWLLALAWLFLGGCRHVTDPEAVHVGTPTASVSAEAILERYRNDVDLAEELYAGKRVHIKRFRVDKSGSLYLWMKADDYTLRLDHPSDAQKIREGDTIKLYCEGQGLKEKDGKQIIRFHKCRGRLEED
jgi:hypothetical protein